MNKLFLVLICLTTITASSSAQKMQESENKLRHVVMFGWKANADTNAIKKVIDAFRALPSKISCIKGFEWGENNSPEGLNQGLNCCFFLTFSSEADRNAYLVHPAHKEFGAMLKPVLDKVTVLDYWVRQ